MKNIIFDFDGVIVDTFEFHLRKLNEFFGINITAEEYRSVHDGNFYENDLDKLNGLDWTKYANFVSESQRKLPLASGAKEVITSLAASYSLYLITSGWRSQVEAVLTNNGVGSFFKAAYYADDGLDKHSKFTKLFTEQEVDNTDCLFVTDTLGDVLEANRLEVDSLAVTFGFHPKLRLQKGNPKYYANSWREIADIVSDLQ